LVWAAVVIWLYCGMNLTFSLRLLV
jgi:hypothetical protein